MTERLGDHSGFTLVELMVSMGLFTISLLAVLSLFTYGSTQSLRVLFTQNSQQAIMEFQENFDAALSNTTRTYYCGCDSPSQNATSRRACTYNAANSIVPAPAAGTQNSPEVGAPAAAGTKSWALFDFEAEYSQTPIDVPLAAELTGSYCQAYSGAAGAMPHYRDRPTHGCKRVYRLRFYNANPQGIASPALPAPGFLFGGRVQLMVCTGQYKLAGGNLECDSALAACPHVAGAALTTPTDTCDNGFIKIAEVPGVRSVTCGQEQVLGDPTTEADNFRLDFTYNSGVTSDPNLISTQAGLFEKSYSFSATFRNLVERGLYFSRPSKTANCTPNGSAPPGCTGVGAGLCLDNVCCSGTIDFTTTTCTSKANCWPAGHVLDSTNWPQQRFTCCSNQAVLKDIGGTDTYECL